MLVADALYGLKGSHGFGALQVNQCTDRPADGGATQGSIDGISLCALDPRLCHNCARGCYAFLVRHRQTVYF